MRGFRFALLFICSIAVRNRSNTRKVSSNLGLIQEKQKSANQLVMPFYFYTFLMASNCLWALADVKRQKSMSLCGGQRLGTVTIKGTTSK